MSPEDDQDMIHALATEKVIRALEVLATECEENGLSALGASLSKFALKCQSDYLKQRRKMYKSQIPKAKGPGSTKH